MAALHYLTVQDMLWINLQVTKKVNHFSFARLEEATFYQYAYGSSHDVLPQAARFLSGFLRMKPFDAGNEATALVGLLGFLALNGYELVGGTTEAQALLASADRPLDTLTEALRSRVKADDHAHHTPDLKALLRSLVDQYALAAA